MDNDDEDRRNSNKTQNDEIKQTRIYNDCGYDDDDNNNQNNNSKNINQKHKTKTKQNKQPATTNKTLTI